MSSRPKPLIRHESTQLQRLRIELAKLVTQIAPLEGLHSSSIPGLKVMRVNSPTLPRPSLYEPWLCIVVQGRKRSILGHETYRYDPLNYLTISVPLLATSQIIEASREHPFLGILIDLDARTIGELLLQLGIRETSPVCTGPGLFVARTSLPLLDAVFRLTSLLFEPQQNVSVLAPLLMREIHYRLLAGEYGHRLRELCLVDSQVNRIARAIELLRRKFREPLRIEELAAAVHMSQSSLHHRFKAVTAMSPVQFQKQLRLHEARRLMLTESIEAAAAAHRVGYESASQFSREYRRLFGAPPLREIEAWRRTSTPSALVC